MNNDIIVTERTISPVVAAVVEVAAVVAYFVF